MIKYTYSISDLKNVMKKLLSENGCPWDKAQTHETLKKYLIEECYEAVDAISNNDMDNLCEELGDVLFQVVFHSELASKEGYFDLDKVINDVTAKMVYRHPHIFGDTSCKDADEVLYNWDKLKEKEKGYKSSDDIINSVPKALPSLMRSQKVISKVKKYKNYNETNEEIINRMNSHINALKRPNQCYNQELEEIIGNFF